MLLSVLRASSPGLDVDAFLATHRSVAPDRVWRIGEPRGSRGPFTTNGFNVSMVADAGSFEDLVQKTLRALEGHRPMLAAARELAVGLEIDLGIDVGSEEAFVRSCCVTPEQLRCLAELGVSLCVTAYPARR